MEKNDFHSDFPVEPEQEIPKVGDVYKHFKGNK
jgi:hypothetical protein